MDVASLLIACLGVLLGALSLGWQAATYLLSGGRAKVEPRVGAVHASGSNLVTMPVDEAQGDWAQRLNAQGYTRPVVALQVRNPGRLPITVQRWSFPCIDATPAAGLLNEVQRQRNPRHLTELIPVTDSIGPPIPHRIEAGGSETWAIDAHHVHAFATATKESFKLKTVWVSAKVELGDGRVRTTRERLTF